MDVYRGDIYWAELKNSYPGESIQEGVRPVVVVSNDLNNKYSTNINVLPVTSKIKKKPLQVHVSIGNDCGLPCNSLVLAESETTIPKICLESKIGQCTFSIMRKIEMAMQIQKGIVDPFNNKKVDKLINAIKDADKLVNEYNLPRTMNFRVALIDELISYCEQHGVDYHLFWVDSGYQYKSA